MLRSGQELPPLGLLDRSARSAQYVRIARVGRAESPGHAGQRAPPGGLFASGQPGAFSRRLRAQGMRGSVGGARAPPGISPAFGGAFQPLGCFLGDGSVRACVAPAMGRSPSHPPTPSMRRRVLSVPVLSAAVPLFLSPFLLRKRSVAPAANGRKL